MSLVLVVGLSLLAVLTLPLALELFRPGSLFRFVDVYLDLFAGFAGHGRDYVRLEHREIGQSIRSAYLEHHGAGRSHMHSTLVAIIEHLSEVQPFALASKTRTDEVSARNNSATSGCASLTPLDDTAGWRAATAIVDATRGVLSLPLVSVMLAGYVVAIAWNLTRFGLTSRAAAGAFLATAFAGMFVGMLFARRNISARFCAGQHRVDWHRSPGRPDWLLVSSLAMLFVVLGAQYFSRDGASLLHLASAVSLAVLLMAVFNYQHDQLAPRSPLFAMVAVAALALAVIPGVGSVQSGRVVLEFGVFAVEPAGISAVATILYVAAWLTFRREADRSDFSTMIRCISIAGFIAALLMLQGNPSAALMIGAIVAVIFAVTGGRWSLLVAAVGGGFQAYVILFFLRYQGHLAPTNQLAPLPDISANSLTPLLMIVLAIVVWRGIRTVSTAASPFGAVLAATISAWFALTGLAYGASVWGVLSPLNGFSPEWSATALGAQLFAAMLLVSISRQSIHPSATPLLAASS